MNTENKQNEIKFNPIGIIHSPFKDTKDFPKQPYEGKGIKGTIEIYPEFIEFFLIYSVMLNRSLSFRIICS